MNAPHTRLTETLGVDVPTVQAPVGSATRAALDRAG